MQDHKHHEHVRPSAGDESRRYRKREKEGRELRRKKERRKERDRNVACVKRIRTCTSGSASARALTSPLSVQARQPPARSPSTLGHCRLVARLP